MTPPRVVYDTMIFVQWALLPAERSHGTATLFSEGRIELCLSVDLEQEIVRALRYPELKKRAPHLTEAVIRSLIDAVGAKATFFEHIPSPFSHAQHGKDDHIFNLAIAAKADFLVTWERRHLEMDRAHPEDARRLHELAPQLRIVTPKDLVADLKTITQSAHQPERERPARLPEVKPSRDRGHEPDR